MDDKFIAFMYDKIGKIYSYLEKIMGDVYHDKLSYEDLPKALEDLKKHLLFRKKDCESNGVFCDEFVSVLEYLDGIANTLLEGTLKDEEVIPTLGDLAINILGVQKYFTGGNEYLERKIEDKEKSMINALESTKNRIR